MDTYCGNIIAQCREDTGETDYSATNGIPQSTLLEAFFTGQVHCQGIIYNHAPAYFDIETERPAIAQQSVYALPGNTYIGGSLLGVFFSPNGSNEGYYELNAKTPRFASGRNGLPAKWIPYGASSFKVDPAPADSQGKFKIVHNLRLDTPDLRRGRIKSVALNGGADAYVSIEFENDSYLDTAALAAADYLCVNSLDGTVTYYNIPYSYLDDYNGTTKVLTFLAEQPMASGTITAGSFITCGKYSTTHSKLDEICRPVISAFVRRQCYLSKSSTDAADQENNIKIFSEVLVKQYQKWKRGIKSFPYQGKFE